MTPWLDDGDVRLHHGEALATLRERLEAIRDALIAPWRSSPSRIRELERKLARESENRVDCFMANARRMDKLERRIDQLLPRDTP